MEENKDDQDGLPEIYLSLSHGPEGERDSTRASSDTDQNAGNDTDSDVWTALLPEVTTTGYFELSQEISMAQQEQYSFSLGVREEIEGVSSQDSSAAGNILANRTPVLYGGILNANQSERNEDASCSISQPGETEGKNIVAHRREVVEGSGQRGETPGSDCPPVAGVGAFSRVFMQPLKLDTNFNATSNNELIFSPGGDEGIMLPGGVHAYYDSGSDTEPLEWGTGGEDESEALSQVRDAVEGADSGTPSIQASLGNISPNELEDMERNSPAGLSTPDTDLDLNVAAANNLENQKLKNSVRPPVVGQSEELLVQTLRKDLGSTDGEESEDESQKRLPLKSAKDAFSTPDFQPGSLGSQSENTDSVNTVLDMSRGEIQGCETDETLDTPLLSPSIVTESLAQSCPKPTFVVGGLISPRVKFRQFQNTVRDRMQDMKASLELQPGIDSQVHVDRDQFLSQPPLYPPNTSISEQEISLTSMISVDSTNHPDSSERVTSPSALSVSSAASSRKMEWDSGADVGYSGNLTGNTQEHLVTSLSTLERIAIGNYASVLRTEPEGTTQVKEKQKASKKSAKSNSTKLGNNSNVSRQVLVEGVTLSPSRSLRLQQTRDKINLSSSDEDFDSKLSSPAQSPRRRLRRRSLITISKDMESPSRKMNKGQQGPNRRLVEVTQELHNEGKSSSLVELASTSVKVPEYKRSSSQQSLSLQGRPESNTNVKSNMSAAEGSVSSVTTAVYQNNKLEPFLGASSIVNITTSTGSIIQNVLPIPQVGVSTSTNSSLGREKSQQYAKEKKDDFKSVNEDTKSSPQSSLQSTESQTNIHGRTGTSSGNDFSSKSHDSSDMETPSDMKDTDANSYTSYQLSDVELVNLKAKKNSENAKSHENIAKKCRSRVKSTDHNNWKDSNDSNSWSSSLQVEGQRGSPQDSESVLESQVSLQSSNNYLHALSVKLKERIHVLLDNGSLKKVQDYNKLQDYIQFIGVPSTNEEECRLKQGVANVIVRMFGEIGLDDTDTSNTFTSEASEILTTDSQTSDQRPHTTSEHTSVGHEDTDVPSSHGMLEAEDFHQCGITADEMPVTTRSELCVNTGSTVTIVPYRPLSATRTYFMAVSHERDEGLVEGEQHIHTPERGSPAVLTPNSDLEVSRGQAEGQLQHEELSVSLPSTHQVVPCQNNDTIVDCNSEEPVSLAVVNDPSVKTSGMSKNQTEEPGSASGAATLPHDWGFDLRAGKIQGTSSRGVTSDECSPRHTGHRLAWDRRSSWHEEDQGQGCRDSVNWWSSTTRSERLYKDKRGTLHVAKQPPGYMDDHDSHPSESTSDHDHHHPENNDTESQEDTRRGPVRPWTSSGSESAYETIRERHRHVDEALASSFEFYSTSPRDARLLGYVSSDAGEQGQEYEDHLQREPSPELPPPPTPPLSEGSQESPQPPSPPLSEQPVSSRSARTKRHASRWQQQQLTDRQNSSPSSHTDGNDVSSQVSFIHLQKQRYVRKIQRHILTLEKLERALLEQLGDSIGSSSSFRRHVTEGHSRTESDTNAKSQIRDILGQSGTTASSIISSDFSDGAVQKEPYQPCPRERVSKNDLIGVKPVSQESPSHSAERSESTKSVTGHSTFERSHTSSRMTFSQLSSDLTSSRASTMKYIEEEVKKLVLTEERSRQMMKNSRLHSQKTRREDLDFQGAIRKMRRKEPRGEDDPVHSQLSNKRRTSDDILDYKLYVKNRILKECVMLDSKVTAGSKDSSRQFTQPCVISEEEFTDRAISDSQISRQGDGREARDQNQGIRVSPVIYKEDATNSTLLSSPVRERNSQSQNEHLRKKLLRDFGQMFPSRENVLLSECENRSENVIGHSVGVQTSDSLLYLSRSSRQSKGSSSSRPSSGTTSDKSESLNNASSRGKRMSSKSGSGKDQNEKCFSDEKQVLESVSQRVNKVKADEQSKQQPRPVLGNGERRCSRNDRAIISDNYQFDRNDHDRSSSRLDRGKKGKPCINMENDENVLVYEPLTAREETARDGTTSSRAGTARKGASSSRVESARDKTPSSRAGTSRDEISTSRAGTARDGSSSSRAETARDRPSSSRTGTARDRASSSKTGTARDRASSSKTGTARDRASSSKTGTARDRASSSKTGTARDRASSSKTGTARDRASSSKTGTARDKASSSRTGTARDGASSRAGTESNEMPARARSARDENQYIKEHKTVVLSKPDSENNYNKGHRTRPMLSAGRKRSENRYISEDRTMVSVAKSANRREGNNEDTEIESSTLGSQNEHRNFGEHLSGSGCARSEDHLSSDSKSSSRVESPVVENELDIGYSCQNVSVIVSENEYQHVSQNDNEGNKQNFQEQTEPLSSRPQAHREDNRLGDNLEDLEASVQEQTEERMSNFVNSDCSRASVLVISPTPDEEMGGQIQVITKSFVGNFMKFSRNNNSTEPPVATSSALSEDSDTLRNLKNLKLYTGIHDNQRPLNVRNCIDDMRSEIQMLKQKSKAVIGSQCNEKSKGRPIVINIRCKSPVKFDVPFDNFFQMQPNRKKNFATTARLKTCDKQKENLTLQEALARARPDYIQEASDRRALIRLKKEMRQAAQSHNHQIMAQIPANLQTPSTLQRFLYKPDIAPLFSYKDIREQNRRLYQLLPEANFPSFRQHLAAQNHTNRLMGKLYSQKLRKKVVKGQVSHAHKDVVTPLASRTKY